MLNILLFLFFGLVCCDFYLYFVITYRITRISYLKRINLNEKKVETIFTFPKDSKINYNSQKMSYVNENNVLFLRIYLDDGSIFTESDQLYGIDIRSGEKVFFDDQWTYQITPYLFFQTPDQQPNQLIAAQSASIGTYGTRLYVYKRNISDPNDSWSKFGFPIILNRNWQIAKPIIHHDVVTYDYTNELFYVLERVGSNEHSFDYYLLEIKPRKWELNNEILLDYTPGCMINSINYYAEEDVLYCVLQLNKTSFEFGIFDRSTKKFKPISLLPDAYFNAYGNSAIGNGKYYQEARKRITPTKDIDILIVLDLKTGVVEEEIEIENEIYTNFLFIKL